MFYGAIGIRRSGCRHFPEHESDTSNIINKCDVRTMACRQPYSRPYTKLSYSTSASIFRGIQRLEDSLCGILVLEAEHKMPPTTVRNFFTFMEVACDFFFKKSVVQSIIGSPSGANVTSLPISPLKSSATSFRLTIGRNCQIDAYNWLP